MNTKHHNQFANDNYYTIIILNKIVLLSATADLIASASSVFNDNCQQIPFNNEEHYNNIDIE